MAAAHKSERTGPWATDQGLAPQPETPALRVVRRSAKVELPTASSSARAPRLGLDPRRFVLNLMIVAAAICLYHGVTEPIIKLTQLFVFSDTHSLASAVLALYYDGEWFLATIVLISVSYTHLTLPTKRIV